MNRNYYGSISVTWAICFKHNLSKWLPRFIKASLTSIKKEQQRNMFLKKQHKCGRV